MHPLSFPHCLHVVRPTSNIPRPPLHGFGPLPRVLGKIKTNRLRTSFICVVHMNGILPVFSVSFTSIAETVKASMYSRATRQYGTDVLWVIHLSKNRQVDLMLDHDLSWEEKQSI